MVPRATKSLWLVVNSAKHFSSPEATPTVECPLGLIRERILTESSRYPCGSSGRATPAPNTYSETSPVPTTRAITSACRATTTSASPSRVPRRREIVTWSMRGMPRAGITSLTSSMEMQSTRECAGGFMQMAFRRIRTTSPRSKPRAPISELENVPGVPATASSVCSMTSASTTGNSPEPRLPPSMEMATGTS